MRFAEISEPDGMAVVSCTNFGSDSGEDEGETPAVRCSLAECEVVNELLQDSHMSDPLSSNDNLRILHAPSGEVELTATNISVRSDMHEFWEPVIDNIKHTEVPINGCVALLVTRHLPTAILRTSKLIRSEAQAIVKTLIEEFIKQSQTKIIEFGKNRSKIRHCKILECLITQISRERNAVECQEDYDIQAILRRS
ncbi:hypothetical protein G6011_11485 [Alternaria panax]|uniref:Uncharacterized protein n=1 Tax=Alternaria panax TaxID=48097 RepID=A0AAD4IE40_9PLEO|nr:hypothetical protein G6011_11485 [Alternaria panax]